MLPKLNEAASCVSSGILPDVTVAPSTREERNDVPSASETCGSGQRARPASRNVSCADSRLRRLFARSRLFALTSSMNADSSASWKLFHQSVFGQMADPSTTGPMKRCGTSLSGNGGGSITAHAPSVSNAGTQTIRVRLFIGQGHYRIETRRFEIGRAHV